jgi:23S rRNA (uracil1939-C5)-methyltransferase
MQHLDTQAQITHKQNVLLEFLQHQAGITPIEILSPIISPAWQYRRKARLSIKYVAKKNKVLVGFREKSSFYVANIEHCEILPPQISALLPAFSQLFDTLSIREQIPQMEIAITETENAIILRHLSTFLLDDLSKIRDFCATHQLKCYLQPGGINSIHLFYPENADTLLSYQINAHHLTLRFAPQQFVQINDAVNQQMISQALNLLDLQPTDHVLDLFCGIGNFSLPIAKHCASVMGVEGDALAVKQATMNAAENKILNAEFFCEDLSRSAYDATWSTQKFDKILLDPPRSGAKALMPWIAHSQASRIVYISCNPATLARDALSLIQQGYTLIKAGVMDMFPHTQHTEAMALFVKTHEKRG